MNFNLTPEVAKALYMFLSSGAIVFATYVFTRTDLNKVIKAGLVFMMAAVLAVLNAYADGNIADNFWMNFVNIFTLSQGLFWGIMKAAGLESLVAPKDALVSKASDEVAKQVEAKVSIETAKAILDPTKEPALDISAVVVDKKTDIV